MKAVRIYATFHFADKAANAFGAISGYIHVLDRRSSVCVRSFSLRINIHAEQIANNTKHTTGSSIRAR